MELVNYFQDFRTLFNQTKKKGGLTVFLAYQFNSDNILVRLTLLRTCIVVDFFIGMIIAIPKTI